MKKLNFEVDINAPREKVWNTLWEDEKYYQWTSAFGEGSKAKRDWTQGSKVRFLGADSEDGMFSLIAENRPNEYMSIQHLGEIRNGVEHTDSDWAGSMENYTLEERGGVTTLLVDIDVIEDFIDFFSEAWPQALEKVKEIAEN